MILASVECDTKSLNVIDIFRAALGSNIAETVQLFMTSDFADMTALKSHDGKGDVLRTAVAELQQSFGYHRAQLCGAAQLALPWSQGDAIFLTADNCIPSLAQWRSMNDNSNLAICSITRPTDFIRQVGSMAATLISMASQDAITATCEAEEKVVRAAMLQASYLFPSIGPLLKAKMEALTVAVIPPGVETDSYTDLDQKLCRRLLGLPQMSTTILHLGKIVEDADPDFEPLLCAFRLLLDENSNLQLVLATGDVNKTSDADLLAFCDSLSIREHVRIVHGIHQALAPVLCSAADICVSLVDNVASTFDTAILGSMAAGVPAIASDWAGNREIVVHGHTGFLVPTLWSSPAAAVASGFVPSPSDKCYGTYLARRTALDFPSLLKYLRILIDNKELRAKFGAASRQRVCERFSWPVVAKKFSELWQEQLNKAHLDRNRDVASPAGGFDNLFREYASYELDGETEIVASDKGLVLAGACGPNRFSVSSPGIVGQFQLEIQRVLDFCSWPRTVTSIVESGDGLSYEALVWLLKKGFCELTQAASSKNVKLCHDSTS